MDYYKLDEIISIEKKSDASKEKKKIYFDEIITLLHEEGYSDKCEYYIFKGFSFAGAVPLATYMQSLSSEDRGLILKEIISGNEFKSNKNGISFKLLVSLLAQVLNLFPDDKRCIEMIIKEMPSKSKNKEGNLQGDAKKTVEKYFVGMLSHKSILPDLATLEVKNIFITGFCDIITSCLSTLQPTKGMSAQKIKILTEWVDLNSGKETTEASEQIKASNSPLNISDDRGMVQSKPLKAKELFELANLLNSGASKLIATAEHVRSIEKGMNTLQTKTNNMTQELAAAQKDKSILDAKIEILHNELTKSESDKSRLLSEISALKSLMVEKDKTIDSLDSEITRLSSIISVYSSDKENSKSEKLNAIASKLKAEYLDFADVENETMSMELGENFRHQIKSIFKILAKSGIDVGGR